MYCQNYLKRRTGHEHILSELREEIDKLIAEVDAATDRDALLVEERIKQTRVLLDELDKRLALYVQELERRKLQDTVYKELETEPSVKNTETKRISRSPQQIDTKPSINEQIAALHRAGFAAHLIAVKLGLSDAEVELACALLDNRKAVP
ncbi:hypothetical protein PilKf_00047 [Pillotina sp. SPG140]